MSTQKSSFRSVDRTKHLMLSILHSYGGATALGLTIALRADDWSSVLSHTIDPLQFQDPENFQQAYLSVSLFKKLSGVPGINSEVRAAAALEKYVAVDETLQISDRRLSALMRSGYDPSTQTIISIARTKIASWLGDFDWDLWAREVHFGPGSSSSVRGFDVSIFEKMSKPNVEVTKPLLPILEVFLKATRWGDVVSSLSLKEFVEVITVPKTALTDRTIGIEPDANVFFQLGLGSMMRTRLKRVGCDLDNGWSRNAALARKGSITGSLATLDLSSASDRISFKLVRELLPECWFEVLCRARTPYAKVNDALLPLRKFSSMGNGFTFELESLIFLALVSACVQWLGLSVDEVAVFGDDIVCPTEAVGRIEEVFSFLGFEINRSKSYSTGYFRESCGAHYFAGRECKPVYVKEPIEDETQFFKTANAIRRLASRLFGVDISQTRLLPAYRCIVSQLRPHRRFQIPDGYGDGGLCCSFDEVTPHLGKGVRPLGHGCEGFKVRALMPINRAVSRDDTGSLVGVYFGLYRRMTRSKGTRFPTLARFIESEVHVREPLQVADSDGFVSYIPRQSDKVVQPRWMIVQAWCDPA